MAGKKGMHVAWRTSGAYAEAVRARIKAGGIAKRLEDHILGKIQLTATQVQAALGLLRKVVPDLLAAELKAEVVHWHKSRDEVRGRLLNGDDERGDTGLAGEAEARAGGVNRLLQ